MKIRSLILILILVTSINFPLLINTENKVYADTTDFGIISRVVDEQRAIINDSVAIGDTWQISMINNYTGFAVFGLPLKIWSPTENKYVSYIYENNYLSSGYYQVQNGKIGIQIFDYYTKFYSPDMNDVRLYDERWEVQRWRTQGQGSWADIGAQSGTPIFSIVYNDKSIHITKSFNSWAAQLNITYSIIEGKPLKHTIIFTSILIDDTVFRIKQIWSGIVADRIKHQNNETITIINQQTIIDSNLYTFMKPNGDVSIIEDQTKMYWDNVLPTESPTKKLNQRFNTALIDVHAQGIKADFFFGNWTLSINDSLVIDPDTSTIFAATDTYIASWDLTYLTARNAATGDAEYGVQDDIYTGQAQSGALYYVYRLFFNFDTSPLDDTAIISDTTLKLYGHTDASAIDFDMMVVQHTAGDTFSTADFDQIGSITGSVAYGTAGFAVGSYNDLVLDGTGIGWIDKTGTTYLGVRSQEDLDASVPGLGAGNNEYVGVNSHQTAATNKDPKLEITFTVPPARVIGEIPSVEQIIDIDTTVSATYEDVDNLTINITTAETANLLIMASIQTEGSESAVASYRLVFDGVNYQGLTRQVSTLSGNVVLTDLVHNKSAGNYELKLQHSVSVGTLSTINASIYAVQLHNGNGVIPSNDTFVNTDTTTSGTLTDIAGLSTEITLSRTSYVWFSMSWSGEMSVANQQGNFTVDIDGQTLETRFRKWGSANQWGALSLMTRTDNKIPNGTHTVKGVWQRSNAGTLSGLNFSLVVIAGEANGTAAEFEISKSKVITDTTTATSLENIVDSTYIVTLPNATHIIAFLSLDTETNQNNKDVYFTININGSDQEVLKRGHTPSGSSIASIGQVVRTNDTLPIGTSNLTARWHTDAATTIIGENIILTSFVLFTNDTGLVILTVFRHTGLSQILIGGDPQINGSVISVTIHDTVNITMIETINFDFFRTEFIPFNNHTHMNPYLQIMHVDVEINSYALSTGGGVSDAVLVIPNNQMDLNYIYLGIIVSALISVSVAVYAIRKR